MISKGSVFNVLGVPMDLGVSKLGVDMGPTALRYAGIFEALEHAGFSYVDAGDLTVAHNFALDRLPVGERAGAKRAEIARVSEALGRHVYEAAARGEIPLTLGGDHSTAIGAIAGLAKAHGRLGVVWIDAHADANTPETSPSGNIHGMPLAVSLGHGYPELVRCLGFAPKVRPEDVVIIGAKDVDPEEMEFVRRQGIALYSTFDMEHLGLARVMEEAVARVAQHTDAVYVSFDADVMDMRLAPGTGIMTRGGLNYREITYVCRTIGERLPLAGLDIIEVNPLMDKRNQTAELCVELAMALLGVKWTDYERDYLRANAAPSARPHADDD
ncbi:arginase [Desulfovibrio sp. X2]|uniref:arginase n=1 Tax=Desulfovibrio sp. X2 TaxID=941449 RepID=UPI000358D539|nr:arginase [Desulfovibrio sp. X2]EPR44246.1 arginase [Desulfovibrio sp. X2]